MRISNKGIGSGTILTGSLLVLASTVACKDQILPADGPGTIALVVKVNADVQTNRERPNSVVTTPETHVEVTPSAREGRQLHQLYGHATRDSASTPAPTASESLRPPTFNAVRARVRASGTDRTVDLVQSGNFFEATIGDLNPGTYSVTLTGTDGGEVTYYGVNNSVVVVAHDTVDAPINFNSFVATVDPLVTPTYIFTVMPTWSSVVGATTYLVEADTDPNFSDPQQFTSTTNSDILFATDIGTYYLRVRAGNADIDPANAAPSNVQTVEIVPGSGAAGSDQASAADLGAGPAADGLYTDLNILPNEKDWFAVTLRRGQSLNVGVLAGSLNMPSELDPVVSVLDAAGNLIGSNDDIDPASNNLDSRLIGMTTPADGVFYIRVEAYDDGAPTTATSEVGHYELLVNVTLNRLVDGGGRHQCGIGTDRNIYCWGDATFGQLGNGGTTSSSRPVTVSGGLTFVSVASGGNHTCGVTILGKAYCWGSNSRNQLGNGSTANTSAPTAVSGNDVFVTITAGDSHTCGITLLGNAKCWGDNSTGEQGNGTMGSAVSTPAAVGGSLKFYTIDAGDRITCGITVQFEAYCWGEGYEGQLGDGMSAAPGGSHQVPQPTKVVGGALYSAISTGYYHTCGITLGGAAQCWGWDGEGRLGNGASSGTATPTPVAVTGGLLFSSIDADFGHTCGLSTAGAISCWGVNSGGQVGDGTFSQRNNPTPVTNVGVTYTDVAAGGVHSCGRATTGTIYCWGDNSQGQVGNGSTIPNAPQAVVGGASFGTVSAGFQHTCGLTTTGQAICWGNGNVGQLGTGTFGIAANPTPVNTALSFTSISSGALHVCAIESTTMLASCWGYGAWGQLGNSGTANQASPVQAGVLAFASITAGDYHTCAVTPGQDLYCWGRNLDGQLGDATNVDKSAPTAIASQVGAVSAGGFHTCALDNTTKLAYCWGYNGNGQLGTGNLAASNVPVAVTGGLAFDEIAAGEYHTCGRVAGAVYCWGWNGWGQLGNGSFDDSSMPIRVSGSQTFQRIEAGSRHTCGVTTGNQVFCWGAGDASQTGLGSRNNTDVPTAVATGGGIIGASAADSHSCAVNNTGTARCWGSNSRGQIGTGVISSRTSPEIVVGGTVFLDPETPSLVTRSVRRLDSHDGVVHRKRGR